MDAKWGGFTKEDPLWAKSGMPDFFQEPGHTTGHRQRYGTLHKLWALFEDAIVELRVLKIIRAGSLIRIHHIFFIFFQVLRKSMAMTIWYSAASFGEYIRVMNFGGSWGKPNLNFDPDSKLSQPPTSLTLSSQKNNAYFLVCFLVRQKVEIL